MRYDTAGNKIEEIIICSSCQQDTAGNHEWNCPNNNNKIENQVCINKKSLWGLLGIGTRIEEEDIEEVKKSLFPERVF